jgi:predicted nucleotidyltransferase
LENGSSSYPGTSRHRALLQAVASYYENDRRILAVAVFGSLARGTWDSYSDLDLDIVVADGVQVPVVQELQQLCDFLTSIGETAALIIPDGDDAGDVVFESLMQLSARYHPLSATSPQIVDSMQVLTGRISQEAITAAGVANKQPGGKPLRQLLDECVRYVAVGDVALQRRRVWITVEVLYRMRRLLLELYARTHQGVRAHQAFEVTADTALQARLGTTLPQYSLVSLQQSLLQVMDILQSNIDEFSGGELQLADGHHKVLERVRQNQQELSFVGG